jgi:hypothetical protein
MPLGEAERGWRLSLLFFPRAERLVMRCKLLALSALFVLGAWRESVALVDIIIDDSQADFSEFRDAPLTMGTGNNSYGGSYRYIQGWGTYDGCGNGSCPDARSARVFYRWPDDVFPKGDHLYNVYAWVPSVPWEWHVLDAAADGLESLDQDIDWAGQFNTRRQWLEFDEHDPFDPVLGGRWLKLGPGPQADFNADGGAAFHLNPVYGRPYFFIQYQPFYEGLIAFDAIRIVQIPEGPLRGDYNRNGAVDAADWVIWRTTKGVSVEANVADRNMPDNTFDKTFPLPAADGNSTGTVDDADNELWRLYFGRTEIAGAGQAAAAPEPATLALLGMAGWAWSFVCFRPARKRVRS